jgi:hypothetical protein
MLPQVRYAFSNVVCKRSSAPVGDAASRYASL